MKNSPIPENNANKEVSDTNSSERRKEPGQSTLEDGTCGRGQSIWDGGGGSSADREGGDQQSDGEETNGNTEERIESKSSLLRSFCNLIKYIPRYWPRTYYVLRGIVFPLWILILIATLCGNFLARLESPYELETNDKILASLAMVEYYGVNLTNLILYALPSFCWNQYKAENNVTTWVVYLETAIKQGKTVNQSAMDTLEEIQNGISIHMKQCGPTLQPKIALIYDKLRANLADIADPTFNWNRCYNRTTLNGHERVIFPSQAQRDASKPSAQLAYYKTVWSLSQAALYEQYLNDFDQPNLQNNSTAYDWSVGNATGRTGCIPNNAASAWFWFTVMTTVGRFLAFRE